MKLATWNVNSLNVRLPHVLDWLIRHEPDVLCLQETKVEDAKFPLEPLRAAGYEVLYSGQRTYNGVAILSRSPGSDVVTAIPGFECEQKRVLAATIAGVRVICVYVPNGQAVTSPKYEYKLSWLSALNRWLTSELQTHRQVAVAGDFNIAPEDRDVHDPRAWEGQVLFSAPERDALAALITLGLKDGFRLFEQPDASYTWWDYRMNAFRRKMGLRIDHVLLSGDLAQKCSGCAIDVEPRRLERPSDHAPISVELQL
jgi:exodeoxyribonuclease III